MSFWQVGVSKWHVLGIGTDIEIYRVNAMMHEALTGELSIETLTELLKFYDYVSNEKK